MSKFFIKKLPIISFIFIPIIFLWHPNWLGFLGIQPYWPLFWLLPWSMINGPINGLIFGFFLGLILDSLTLDSGFTQIPGLILCGILYFLQILFANFSDSAFLLFIPSFQNILAEVFLTGFFAPLICSKLLRIFKFAREKSRIINFGKQ